MAIHTYPGMNAKIVGLLRLSDNPVDLYAAQYIEELKADVRPVVLCRDCIYWQKPQVWQNDGTFRDYEPGEYEKGSIFGGVSLEVGINYGSFCALYNQNHENEIPQFMGENDFCSKGYKREER